MKRVLVVGGRGSLGGAILSFFKQKSGCWLASVGFQPTELVENNIILKNRDDFRAQAEEVWRIVPTLQSHNCFLVQSITFNHLQEIIFGSFSFVPPQYVMRPMLQNTCDYIVNLQVKIWHVCLGGANNMHPLSWGGGGTNGKDPNFRKGRIKSSSALF